MTKTRIQLGTAAILAFLGTVVAVLVPWGCGADELLTELIVSSGEAGFLVAPAGQTDEVQKAVVRLINESAFAVDVELFVSSDPQVRAAADVIGEGNRFVEGVGFLSLGLLDVGESAEVVLACGSSLAVATAGGVFLDRRTGDVVAEGAEVRFAQLGPQFDCGDRVTIRYGQDGEGVPTTALRID